VARYKVLKSVAHAMGHSFTSLMNYRGDDYVMGHLLRTARASGEATLAVDLLTGEAGPPQLLTPEVRDSIAGYVRQFPTLVRRHDTDMRYLLRARMTVAFDLSRKRPVRHAPGCEESPFVCVVEIEDDRGKVWSARVEDWWYPESGEPISVSELGRVSAIKRLGQVIWSVWRRSFTSFVVPLEGVIAEGACGDRGRTSRADCRGPSAPLGCGLAC
jgi:hypothetical protein